MIFSLESGLRATAAKVKHDNRPVSYSGGNIDALHKWIAAMNGKAIEKSIGMAGADKYPLIWLVEGWEGTKIVAGIKFEKVIFYISCNSDVAALNEDRKPNFDMLYKVANDFIAELRKVLKVTEDTITWSQKANFSTSPKGGQQTQTYDVWDTVIVEMDLIIYTNCIKKLGSL